MSQLPQMRPMVAGLPEPRFGSLRIIVALMLREASSTYGRSPGGYLWAFLSPLGMILLLTFGFSLMLRTPALGNSFMMFYASGYLPFALYSDISSKVSSSLGYSRTLMAYRGVSWAHSVIARFTLNLLTQITVYSVVYLAILALVETQSIISLGPIILGFTMAAAIGLSVGLMNSLLLRLFQVWGRIWAILTRPLFFISGIFFLYRDLPESAREILWFNPLIHATGMVRDGFYSTYQASYVSLIYVFGVSMALMALALLLLRRYYRRAFEV